MRQQRFYNRLILLLTVGCWVTGSILPEACNAEKGKKTLSIGWAGPLSGNSSVLGIDSARAVAMVFEAANHTPHSAITFRLVTEDDQYSTPKAVTAYRALVDVHKVPVLFFLTYGGLFAVSPQAERDRVLLIDPLDCNEEVAKLPPNTLCVAAMTEGIGQLNARVALKNNHRRPAILYFEDDPFMATVAKSSTETLTGAGAEPVLAQGYRATQSDFRPILLRAKKAGADSLYFYGYDEAAAAMQQARELGISVPFYATATVLSPGFIKAAGSALEDAIFSVFTPSNAARYDAFIKRFTERYGAPPILDIATVPSFDVANIIVEFAQSYLGDVESPHFASDLRDHLYKLREYQGASGPITMASDGATRSLRLRSYRVQDGKRVPL